MDDVNALLSSAAEAARPRIEEPKKQWPQPFETGGGSYVFASDVGLYWDQDSMFYYSPASKLYYSVFLGKYFRCDTNSSSSKPFHEVAPPVPVDDLPFVQDVGGQQPAGVQTTNTTPSALKIASGVSLSLKLPAKKKAPISFGLKPAAAVGGKTLKTAADNTASSAAFAAGTAPAGATRRSAQDIAKWSQLQRKTKIEEQQQTKKAGGVGKLPFESASAPNPKSDRAATQAVKAPEPAVTPSVIDALANTAVEVPICLVRAVVSGLQSLAANLSRSHNVLQLCRRKFNSIEVLRKHETMSKLHLENLAKSRQNKEAVAAEHRERDRAAMAAREKREREAATQEAEAKRQRLAEAAASSKPAQEAKAAAALEQGIGGKLLKMMGWKSGEGLGKRSTGITAPISASGASASGGSSMAGLGARSALPVSIPESASFKERVQSFTRARYDATDAKEQ